MSQKLYATEALPPRVAVLHPYDAQLQTLREVDDALAEAVNLVEALRVEVVLAEMAALKDIHPKFYLGKGKVEAWAQLCADHEIEAVMVDVALSPTQHRNLEQALKVKVMDRTGVILEIFAARARTKAAKLQVELAQVEYQLSRLVRAWTHLERQRGGMSKTGGPGERQLELDRRMLRDRARFLKEKLKTVHKQRQVQRKARQKSLPHVALVGYTNAGKSTLFEALTQEAAGSANKLFATLDPLTRVIQLPENVKVTLSDTVGFISGLPHQLVAAFESTLEEVAEADVIVQVHDASHPDWQAQAADVDVVLAEIGAENVQRIHVANKIDLVQNPETVLSEMPKGALAVSALKEDGLAALEQALLEQLAKEQMVYELQVPAAAGEIYAYLHRQGMVTREVLEGETWRIEARLDLQGWQRVIQKLKVAKIPLTPDLEQLEPAQEAWES